MMKLMKGLLLIILLLIAGGAVFVATKKPAQRPAATGSYTASPEKLARGAYLFEHVLDCGGCHSQRDWTRFGGPKVPGGEGRGGWCLGPEEHAPGMVCAPNISSHMAGIGGWSDGEVARAVREGVRRDGTALFPMMPYMGYRELSDSDTEALIVYLRTLPPIAATAPETKLAFPVSVIVKFLPQPLAGPVADPAPEPVARGRYLATVAGCMFCHTPTDEHGGPVAGRELAGGQEFIGPWGKVRSANISADPTGIGGWSRDNFVATFAAFRDAGAVAQPVAAGQNTPMPWLAYAGLTDADLGALYDFLRTVPPQTNQVEKRPRPSPTMPVPAGDADAPVAGTAALPAADGAGVLPDAFAPPAASPAVVP